MEKRQLITNSNCPHNIIHKFYFRQFIYVLLYGKTFIVSAECTVDSIERLLLLFLIIICYYTVYSCCHHHENSMTILNHIFCIENALHIKMIIFRRCTMSHWFPILLTFFHWKIFFSLTFACKMFSIIYLVLNIIVSSKLSIQKFQIFFFVGFALQTIFVELNIS